LYHDLAIFEEIRNTFIDRFFYWKKKNFLIKWLFYRSNSWLTDYYYVAPAINVFPEKYYKWLTLVRMLFVIDQLGLTLNDTILSSWYWFKDQQRHFNVEHEKFFLQEYLFEEETSEYNKKNYLQKDEPYTRYSMYTGVNNFLQRFSLYLQLIAYGLEPDDFGLVGEIDSNTFLTEIHAEPGQFQLRRNLMTYFNNDIRDTGDAAEILNLFIAKDKKKKKKNKF